MPSPHKPLAHFLLILAATSAGGCSHSTGQTTLGSGRVIACTCDAGAVGFENDAAGGSRITLGPHTVVVEPGRVVVGGAEKATLSPADKAIEVHVEGGSLRVVVGGAQVYAGALE